MTEQSLNQINALFLEIAEKHKQINSFFWGDFSRAQNQNNVDFPMCVVTPAVATKTPRGFSVNLVLTICDKVSKDWRELNEVQSDTMRIVDDITDTMMSDRWTAWGTLSESNSFEPFIDRGKDELTGWAGSIVLDIHSERDLCAIPFDNYNFDESLAAICDPVRILDSNGDLITTIPAGGSYTVGDGTVNVNKSDSTLISAVNVAAGDTTNYNVADSNVSNSDDSYSVNVKATESLEIADINVDVNAVNQGTIPAVQDIDINTVNQTPTGTTVVGTTVTMTFATASEKHSSEPYKTGQTVSYATGDDGDLEDGNGTTFWSLGYDNGFGGGNQSRFTLKAGTQLTSSNFYNDGTVTSTSLIVDWSTWDRVNDTVLCWWSSRVGSAGTWTTKISDCQTAPSGEPATGWKMPNTTEMQSILEWNGNGASLIILRYLQNYNTSSIDMWTSTTSASATTSAIRITNNISLTSVAKTGSSNAYQCRYYSLTELGL